MLRANKVIRCAGPETSKVVAAVTSMQLTGAAAALPLAPVSCQHTLSTWKMIRNKDSFTRSTLEKLGLAAGAESTHIFAHKIALPAGTPNDDEQNTLVRVPLMVFPLVVSAQAANVFSTLHGGALLTLVDVCSSMHLIHELEQRQPGSSRGILHVSASLDCKFMSAARVGDSIAAVSRIDKLGKSVAFTSVDFFVATQQQAEDTTAGATNSRWTVVTSKSIAQGTHVKSISARKK